MGLASTEARAATLRRPSPSGKSCQRPGVDNGRCPNHGGCSTGPKPKAGRKRIATAQRSLHRIRVYAPPRTRSVGRRHVNEMARRSDVTANDVNWTLGQYDCMAIWEAPDDAAVTVLSLRLCSGGNIRAETLRAFSSHEMAKIIGKVV
jgi:uncharacterized protein with GYD domain